MRRDSAGDDLLAQAGARIPIERQQPENAVGDVEQQADPPSEDVRRDLESLVEAAEDECLLGQAVVAALACAGRDLAPAVVRLIAAGEYDERLVEEALELRRHREPVDERVVDEAGSHRSGIAEIGDLNRSRP